MKIYDQIINELLTELGCEARTPLYRDRPFYLFTHNKAPLLRHLCQSWRCGAPTRSQKFAARLMGLAALQMQPIG